MFSAPESNVSSSAPAQSFVWTACIQFQNAGPGKSRNDAFRAELFGHWNRPLTHRDLPVLSDCVDQSRRQRKRRRPIACCQQGATLSDPSWVFRITVRGGRFCRKSDRSAVSTGDRHSAHTLDSRTETSHMCAWKHMQFFDPDMGQKLVSCVTVFDTR